MGLSYPLSFPTTFRPARVRIGTRSRSGVSVSPFTFSQEVFEHQGDMWRAEVSLPQLGRADAEVFTSFLASLSGRRGTFTMADPANLAPRGTWAGTPLVNGAHAARTKTIAMDGFSAGATVKAGDRFQVGAGATAHLYMVVQDATADGGGVATLEIWPRLRASVADNESLVTTNPVGLWRLDSDDVDWEIQPPTEYLLSFTCIEAL